MTAGHRRWWAAGLAALAAGAIVATVVAQSASGWDVSWRATSSGGGVSAGGNYVVTGSLGQPVAAHSAGGAYAVDSGYLAGTAEKYRAFFPALASDKTP